MRFVLLPPSLSQLGADAVTGLADAGEVLPTASSPPAASSIVGAAASADEAKEVVPTVKLEGELAAQFQKVIFLLLRAVWKLVGCCA